MIFKYLMAIGFIGTVSVAVASMATVPTPEPKVEAPALTPAPFPTQSPAPEPAKAEAPKPVPPPVKEAAPDSSPIQHALLNALEKEKNSTQVDERIAIILQDAKYEVSIKLNPRGGNMGSLTLEKVFTVVSEDYLRNAKEKGEYTSYAYKNGNKIGITDLSPGSTGKNYEISRVSLKFKKIS